MVGWLVSWLVGWLVGWLVMFTGYIGCVCGFSQQEVRRMCCRQAQTCSLTFTGPKTKPAWQFAWGRKMTIQHGGVSWTCQESWKCLCSKSNGNNLGMLCVSWPEHPSRLWYIWEAHGALTKFPTEPGGLNVHWMAAHVDRDSCVHTMGGVLALWRHGLIIIGSRSLA